MFKFKKYSIEFKTEDKIFFYLKETISCKKYVRITYSSRIGSINYSELYPIISDKIYWIDSDFDQELQNFCEKLLKLQTFS